MSDDAHLAAILRRFIQSDEYSNLAEWPTGALILTLDGRIDVNPDEAAVLERVKL